MSEYCKGVGQSYIPLDIPLRVNFYAPQIHVFNIQSLPKRFSDNQNSEKSINENDHGYLVIQTEANIIDAIDSALEVNRYNRPILLVILGILSYLIDRPFTVYQITNTSCNKLTDGIALTDDKIDVIEFRVGETDKSNQLSSLLKIIFHGGMEKRKLAASLLDRWRKALYLSEENEGSLFDDEIFLSYFHILEIIATRYQKKIRTESEQKLKIFLSDFLGNVFKLRGPNLEQKVAEKFKQISGLLIAEDQVSISSKICYFLDNLSILDNKMQAFVEKIVKARNAVAHGRQIFQDEVIWPLPPFFILNRDFHKHDTELKVITARAIALYFGLDAWHDEWNQVHEYLNPPEDIIKQFLEKKVFHNLSEEEFIKGTYEGVRPSSIVELYLSRKINKIQLEESMSSLILNIEINEINIYEIFWIAIILADSQDRELSTKCVNIVAKAHANDLMEYSNIKDILRYLEYKGFETIWFQNWIKSGGHIKHRRKNSKILEIDKSLSKDES